jgi:hypothetical protein
MTAGVGPMNMFTMNAAGRATTKQQILSGHQMMGGGPIACSMAISNIKNGGFLKGQCGKIMRRYGKLWAFYQWMILWKIRHLAR